MIVTEYYATRRDGVVLARTYSNAGKMIERDGVRYAEAIDPANLGRVYTETDEDVEQEQLDAEAQLEAMEDAYEKGVEEA